MTVLDPSNNALTVEIMPWIALKLRKFILGLIVHQADLATTLVLEGFGIVLDPCELADNLRNLVVAETIGTSLLLVHHPLEPDVDDWTANDGKGKDQDDEESNEEENDHEYQPSARVIVLLAVVFVREVKSVPVDDPNHQDSSKQEPSKNVKVNSVLVVRSQDPDNVQPKSTFGKPNNKEDLDPENNWDSASFTIMPTDFANQEDD